ARTATLYLPVQLEEKTQQASGTEQSQQSGQDAISLSTSVTKTEKCEWTRWSQWSMCTVTCGSGERLRRRRCSCGQCHTAAHTCFPLHETSISRHTSRYQIGRSTYLPEAIVPCITTLAASFSRRHGAPLYL
ncbi:hypothetical protein GCK32_007500, partial [Trichostrongylus colubriformis]